MGIKTGMRMGKIKRWTQALALVYMLFLLGVCFPGQTATEEVSVDNVRTAGKGEKEQTDERAEEKTEKKIEEKTEKETADRETEGEGADGKGAAGEETVEKQKIALTFDDGPNARYTPKLLDGLKERGVKASFFLIGKNIEQGENAEIVKREQQEGHLIGNHTYHHVEITRIGAQKAFEEIRMTNELIQGITGQPVEYMRPPFGSWQKILEKKIHVIPVLWTIDPLDWATENVDEIVSRVVTDAKENAIILLHDCYESSVKAALRIVDLLQAEGYQFVTVDELLTE